MKLAYYIDGDIHAPLKHYAEQLEIRYAVANTCTGYSSPYQPYARDWDFIPLQKVQQDLASYGMKWEVYEGVNFIDGVKLGTERREEEIRHFCTLLENLSLLGVRTVCYNWMPVWGWFRTHTRMSLPGGAYSTGFKLSEIEKIPDTGIRVSKDQLWTNLEYFLKRVVPVAEKCKIQLAIHPDDPPVDCLGNVERILTSADAMYEVTQLVPSEYNGITLCQGSFACMNEDIPACIRRFGTNGTLFFSHFRDVVGDKMEFQESYHHNGKTDMYEAMKAYYEVGFTGCMRPDHVPTMYGEEGHRASYAINGNLLATGYMLGLMEAVGVSPKR